ncbi:MAG: hypothetical protein O7D34_05655 [Ignavibacteria bacterium]|nr:hypothetical protein [Ignavibacteria bacterium]
MEKELKQFVPAGSDTKELTMKALVLGVMAVVLGTANAYVGMKDVSVVEMSNHWHMGLQALCSPDQGDNDCKTTPIWGK